MKISIIGAGSVGGLTAMRIAEAGAGEVFLFDIAKDIAAAKVFDMGDARLALRSDYDIRACGDITEIKDSDVVIITAGFSRNPGMTREDLSLKNAGILNEVCLRIKHLSPRAIVVIVTNPLDLMTRLALQITGFCPKRVFGMGVSLDASRFAGLIAEELEVSVLDIDACVIGSHGEGMMPLPRFSRVRGASLCSLAGEEKIKRIIDRTVDRGREIVSLLGSGSAYFAPSAAIAEIVRIIVGDEKRVVGVSAYLDGEYGVRDVCIGIPCRIGRGGVEGVMELELNQEEKTMFLSCVDRLKEQYRRVAAIGA